jgi:hypothetical protein
MAQSFIYGAALPASKVYSDKPCEQTPWKVQIQPQIDNPASRNIDNWSVWPYAMIPVALIGFLLTLRIWNAKPRSGGGSGH